MRGLGHCWEMMWCVLRQFNFVCVVHKEEFYLMRASFYFTHHIDSGTFSMTLLLGLVHHHLRGLYLIFSLTACYAAP